MGGSFKRIGSRLRRLAFRLPTVGDLGEQAIAALAFGLLALVIGGDLVRPAPLPVGAFISMAAVALLVPVVGEEIVFRGILIPESGDGRRWLFLALSVGLFVLWHVFEALTVLPGARSLFLRADFLCLAAGLGLACGILRIRSGSLWTAVMLHWAVVVIWKGLLGGPALTELAAGG